MEAKILWEEMKNYGMKIGIGGVLGTGTVLSAVYGDGENMYNAIHVMKGYSVAFGLDIVSKFKNTNKIISYAQPIAFEMLQELSGLEGTGANGNFGGDDLFYDWLGVSIYYTVDKFKINHITIKKYKK